MKIAFLINNAYGIGGTIRATANLSGAFADRHEVEVVSVHRVQDEPAISLDPRVRLTSLIDMREDSAAYEGDDPLTGQPCTMFPDTGAAANATRLPYSALQDDRIGTWLRTTDADIVIATRPDLNGYLARDGQPRYLRIGQEHLSLDAHDPVLRGQQNQAIAGLDAFITVSEADATQYRAELSDVATVVQCIPNAVPTPAVHPSTLDSNVIVAAGRLVSVKRYDRLVNAFSKVADAHPDWTLRIYGRGPEKKMLREQIDKLGLYDRIFLMGPVSPIETEWAKGAIAAVSSDMESFGMTIVEAMHCGVPVIATDCPHGPAEIIDPDDNGLLVDLDSGTDGYATALNHLMNDEEQRTRLGAAAREKAATFAPSAIAHRYENLFQILTAGRPRASMRATGSALWSRLRTALPSARTGALETVPATPEAETPAPRPTATARVAADGTVSVRFDSATLPADRFDFLMRMRRDAKGREVRVAIPDLTDTAPGPTGIHVMLDPVIHDFAEGRWDCYISPRSAPASRVRLSCCLAEQAPRVGLDPIVAHDQVVAWLPYTTNDGFLALRVWQRPAHAEAVTVTVTEDRADVSARLITPDTLHLPENTSVVAVSRQGEAHDFTVPVTGIRRETGEFTFSVPYAQALSRRADDHDLWDFFLRLGHHTAPIPIGRIGGDIVDRKTTDVAPAALLAHAPHGQMRVKPFFTVTNDLALSVRSVEPSQSSESSPSV
ncbi:glycosyltransferase family 4 protein [Streptomyces sp. NBC_01281]|uniref:glycosyltransferase family 4 protein n=1 Tax=unclassified Streptomyces TaxID=2593676 RepID=UPI002DDC88BD|nr:MULTISPECIES: glycosyltransferase family 4 protein [unclassified Streptomyces]WSD76046.1 glycosyltransferase family 4 protein [Streptomyces sp. NBC_01558]WSK59478.1 glycosyltransferase family 4 protein [Streptomyces sp. NBC_01281]